MANLALWRFRLERAAHQTHAHARIEWSRLRHGLAALVTRVLAGAPLVLHVACIVGGWALVAQAASAWTARPDIVWPAAAGVFLLSVAGWGHLRVVASAGVYALRRRAKEQGRP